MRVSQRDRQNLMRNTYPDFIDNIESILIARKGEPNLGQCIGCSIGRGPASTFKGIPKIRLGIFH